jgi:hypothetical protein
MKRFLPVVLLACLSQFLLGTDCWDPPAPNSGRLNVSDIAAVMHVYSDGSTMSVVVSLSTLQGEVLALTDGDTLTATIGSDERALAQGPSNPLPMYVPGPLALTGDYVARFPASPGASDVSIAFNRPNRPGAPMSTVHVSAPFEVVTRPPGTVVQGDIVTLSFSRPFASADGAAQVAFLGPCLEPAFTVNNQTHDYNIFPLNPNAQNIARVDTSSLLFTETYDDAGKASCSAEMRVELESVGSLDPAFARVDYRGTPSSITSDQFRAFSSVVSAR